MDRCAAYAKQLLCRSRDLKCGGGGPASLEAFCVVASVLSA